MQHIIYLVLFYGCPQRWASGERWGEPL